METIDLISKLAEDMSNYRNSALEDSVRRVLASADVFDLMPTIITKLAELRALEEKQCTQNMESPKKNSHRKKPKAAVKHPLTKLPQNLRQRRKEMIKALHEELARKEMIKALHEELAPYAPKQTEPSQPFMYYEYNVEY